MNCKTLACGLALSAGMLAQIRVTAVTNGASFQPRVAPGSFASIFGENLAAITAVFSTPTLPTQLGGVTVMVNGQAVPLYSVRADQVNFQVPRNTPVGRPTVVVSHDGQSSAAFAFDVLQAAPGILSFGGGQAVATKLDGSLIQPENAAVAGSVIIVYLTGQGPVSAIVADGAPSPGQPLATATLPYSATIGGQNAPIQFLGLAPGFAGLLQANIMVPNLPAGNHPIVVMIGGQASNTPVLAVASASSGLLTRLGSADTGRDNQNVVIRGNYAYVCGSGVSIVNVSNPASPQFLNVNQQGGGQCRLNDNVMVASRGANPGNFTVFTLDNPEQPLRVAGPVTSMPFAGDFHLIGGFAFFTTLWFEFNTGTPNRIFRQHGEVFSVNMTDPARPAVVSTLRNDPANPASSNESPFFGVSPFGRDTMLLMSTTSTLDNTSGGLGRVVVIDSSNAGSLAALRQVAIPRTAKLECGAVDGTTMLATGNTQSWTNPGDFAIRGNTTLTTFDVADPRNPRLIATAVTSEQNTFSAPACVSLGNGYFAVAAVTPPAATENRIMLIDARNTSSPAIVGSLMVPGLAERGLTVAGDKLYAATSAGLTIYQIQRQ